MPACRRSVGAQWARGVGGVDGVRRAASRFAMIPRRLAACAADREKRGVVLVHGFMCNRGLWLPWFIPLQARGHAYVAVNLEPVMGSIDEGMRTSLKTLCAR